LNFQSYYWEISFVRESLLRNLCFAGRYCYTPLMMRVLVKNFCYDFRLQWSILKESLTSQSETRSHAIFAIICESFHRTVTELWIQICQWNGLLIREIERFFMFSETSDAILLTKISRDVLSSSLEIFT